MADIITDPEPIHPDYPLPDIDDPVMRPFWEGACAGKLMQQRDRQTGALHWPPKPLYWKGGGRLEWFEASGKGRVYTWVVAHEPFLLAMRHLLPHVMVVVALTEGPRVVRRRVRRRAVEMLFARPVRVGFTRRTERKT